MTYPFSLYLPTTGLNAVQGSRRASTKHPALRHIMCRSISILIEWKVQDVVHDTICTVDNVDNVNKYVDVD